MLKQYQAVEIKECQAFQNPSKSIATHANANIFLRFFENCIEVHTYEPNSTGTGPNVSWFRQRDLLNETQRLAKEAQTFSIKTVFSQDCHSCLLISTNQLFYIAIIYLPNLQMNQLKNLFFQMIPVLPCDILRLISFNQITFALRVHEEEKNRVMNISVLGYEDRTYQVEFFRISIGREAHLEIFPLSSLKYHSNYSLYNGKPIIKAFFFNKSSQFLVAVHEDIFRCFVKIKGEQQKIVIQHIIVRPLNIKKIIEDNMKRGASQFATLLDIKASQQYGFFLIKYKDGSTMQQRSVKFGMTLIFFRLDSQDFRVSKQNFILLKESAFDGGENCYLKLVHQQASQIFLAIKWASEWRLISFTDKDNIQLYSGKSQIPIINFLMIDRLIRLIFKDRMAIVPINFINQTEMISHRQRNELSQIQRNLALNLAQSFQQNQTMKSGSLISRGVQIKQNDGNRQPISINLQANQGSNQHNNHQQQVRSLQQNAPKPTYSSNMILNNNNRLYTGQQPIPQVVQAKSEDQDDQEDQMQTPQRNRRQNNFTFQKQSNFSEATHMQNSLPQQFNEEIRIPSNFAAQISFGQQQIIQNNTNNPGFHTPVNNLSTMNPMNIIANSINQGQMSGLFSFNQKQIEQENQSTAAITPPSLDRTYSFGDKSSKPKQTTVSPPPPVQPETLKQQQLKFVSHTNQQKAPQYTVRQQRPKYKPETQRKLTILNKSMEKMIKCFREADNKQRRKVKSLREQLEQVQSQHQMKYQSLQAPVIQTFYTLFSSFSEQIELADPLQTQQSLNISIKKVAAEIQQQLEIKQDRIRCFFNRILINPKIQLQLKKNSDKTSIGSKFYKKIEDNLTYQKLKISNLQFQVEEILSQVSLLQDRAKQANQLPHHYNKRSNKQVKQRKYKFEENIKIRIKPFVVGVDLTEFEFNPLFNFN